MSSDGVFPCKSGTTEKKRLLIKKADDDLLTTIETHNLIKYES